MTVLSAQSIRQLGILTPFCERTLHKESGLTFGLGPCTYDVRVAQSNLLMPGEFWLASTLECFEMPDMICGHVMDKSSLARLGISMFNTHLDPGWRGFLTLEITNKSDQIRNICAGSPIAQIKFEWLDQGTDLPYAGKYQDQPSWPVEAILDHAT